MSRRRGGNYAFGVALSVSFLLHLSIVTVFEVVLFFPRHDIEYHEFQIVDPRGAAPVETPPGRRISPPSPENALTRAAEEGIIGPSETPWTSLPEIELPKLEFAQMDLLRLRSEGIEVRSKYEDLFEKEPDDLWARFGQGVSSLGDTLSRFATGGADENDDARPVSRPAPGFEAYVEWLGPPRDRKPLAVAKIEALWGQSASVLPEPLTLYFQVNREGKVTSVLPGVALDEALVDSASEALIRYRFEPVDASAPESQRGSFIVRAAKVAP